jgi:oligopeptide transport system ATP-binding protein
MPELLLEVQELTKHFPVEKGLVAGMASKLLRREEKLVHAVCDVNLSIKKGEAMGLVGESGSGKSTLGRCILQLLRPTSGKVIFKGTDLVNLDSGSLRKMRREMQMVFQDPYTSLNPRIKVGKIIGHPLELHKITKGSETRRKVIELLETVGLSQEHMNRYPHQFSGGQKQRIAIARALAVNPEFIVADEPVSALDVSIQAQIINLLKDLKRKFGLTYLLISHDLAVVEHLSDRISVMYLGKIVESAPTREIFQSPRHPYTQALISAVPIPDPKAKRQRIVLKGEIPNSINPPSGCRFRTRCPYAYSECEREPDYREIAPDHYAACHLIK